MVLPLPVNGVILEHVCRHVIHHHSINQCQLLFFENCHKD
jgi:hypothetical protein